MLSQKQIKLVVGLVLTASSLVLVIAAYSSSTARTDSPATGSALKSKILRRKDRLKDKPNVYELALLRAQC